MCSSPFALTLVIIFIWGFPQNCLTLDAKSQPNSQDGREILVSTTAGNVLGVPKVTRWGKIVQYFGIPYAEIPTESNRFLPSVPLLGQDSSFTNNPTTTTTHHNAHPPPACIQPVHIPEFSHPSIPQGGVDTAEDCLKINVYQPWNILENELLPIVVFIPGDGYSFGDASQYDGSAMAAVGKIIVVTLNYRVGAFGFASMGNATLPGNAGLSDIVSALKFVKHNAKVFNGDPNLVTLAGRFSGGMAISTLVTSPIFYSDLEMTQPLAKQVIIHGGAASSSDYNMDSNPSKLFSRFAGEASCLVGDSKESLICLQNLDPSEIQRMGIKFTADWKPSIDGFTLMKNPITAIEFGQFSSNISFLVGDNFDSGSICYDALKYFNSPLLKDFAADTMTEDQFKSLARENIKEFYKFKDSNLINLTAHEYYFRPSQRLDGSPHPNSWRDAYLRFCGSLYLRNPVELFARYASRLNAVVYRYEFAYRPSTSIHPEYFDGGALGDEIPFLFPSEETKYSPQDLNVAPTFLEAWINFIKTGNPSSPSVTWEKFNEINKTLIGVTRDGLKISTTNNLDADVHFWRHVFLPLHQNLANGVTTNDRDDCCWNDKSTYEKVIAISDETVIHDPPPQKREGISVKAICIGIIGLSLIVTITIYMTLVQSRAQAYKWRCLK